MELKISTMSGKLEGMSALNTSPLTNPFCIERQQKKNPNTICYYCYSWKSCKGYRANCEPAWRNNGEILSRCIIPAPMLPMINAAFFRYAAHGELLNRTHLINLINITNHNPHCTFSLWSKRADILRQVIPEYGKPENLITVFSMSALDTIPTAPPADFDKVFCVVTDPDDERINCQTRCLQCLKCYRKEEPNIIVEELKS